MVCIPLLLGLSRVQKLSNTYKWFIALLALWFLAEVASVITRYNGIKNTQISYMLSVGELVLIVPIFKRLVGARVPLVLLATIGIVLVIIEFIFGGMMNSISLLYECILIVALGLMATREMIFDRIEWNHFWIVGGLMMLFIGSAAYYTSYLRPDNMELLQSLANWHRILLAVVYGTFTIGIWKQS